MIEPPIHPHLGHYEEARLVPLRGFKVPFAHKRYPKLDEIGLVEAGHESLPEGSSIPIPTRKTEVALGVVAENGKIVR